MSLKEFTTFVATLMAIVALSIDALLPAFGFIAQDLMVADPNKVQLVVSALFIGLAIGQLIYGPMSDAFGRKPILYISLAVYFIGTGICYFANSIDLLLAGRVVQGLGVAGPNVTAITLVRDNYKGRQMAKIMSMVMMIFIMVPTIAPALGQLIHLRLKETLTKEKRISFTAKRLTGGFKEVLSNRSTLSLTIAMGMIFGCLIGYINSCQQIIQVQLGAGKMFSVYFGMLAFLIGVSSLVNSRIVEKLGMHFIASRALLTISGSAALFLLVQQFVDVQLWMFLLFAAALFGSFGFISGNLNAMAMEPLGHLAGIASAVIGSISSLLSISIGTTIGQLYNGSVLPFTLGVMLMTGSAWCFVQYAHRHKIVQTAQAD